jgi:hypothetical protein
MRTIFEFSAETMRGTRRRDPDPRNISVEAEGHLEFSACRSAYEHLNGTHRLRVAQREIRRNGLRSRTADSPVNLEMARNRTYAVIFKNPRYTRLAGGAR